MAFLYVVFFKYLLQNSARDENLPPLFCRPRKSPKLNPDSRYASLIDGLGAGSRRQSNVLYPTTDDASSQCGESSPVSRSLPNRKKDKEEKSPLCLTESASRTTLDNVSLREEREVRRRRANNVKSVDDLFINADLRSQKNVPRVLSTIASSSSSDYPSQTVIRESRSLDRLPADMYNKRIKLPTFWKEAEFMRIDSKTDISEKLLNNNYPNGNVIMMSHVDNSPTEAEPLLSNNGENKVDIREKRSRSLDQVVSASSTDSVPDKKSSGRKLLEIPPMSTIIQMINGTGLRNSNVSLRGMIQRYDKQTERESVV